MKEGVDLVGRTGGALQEIVTSVSEISTLVSEIAVSAKNQSAGLLEINKAVTSLDQSTQQNAARLEETTAASEALRNDAVGLVDAICQFKLTQGAIERSGVVSQKPSFDSVANRSATKPYVSSVQPTGSAATMQGTLVKADAEWEDF